MTEKVGKSPRPKGFDNLRVGEPLRDVLASAPELSIASTIDDLERLACGDADITEWEVQYELPDGSSVTQANVVRVKNGIAANYPTPYMRRRDPNCMVIADKKPSDKTTYDERFGESFESLRDETFEWLAEKERVVFCC